MVYPIAHLEGIGPDKLLCIIQPSCLELVLTYRTDAGSKHRIIGDWDVFGFGRFLGCTPLDCVLTRPGNVFFIDRLPCVNPVLLSLEKNRKIFSVSQDTHHLID